MTQAVMDERARINLHLATALSTESGKVLFEWLAVQCCMRGITPEPASESVVSLAQRNALRDLFINLETRMKEISNVRLEHSDGP